MDQKQTLDYNIHAQLQIYMKSYSLVVILLLIFLSSSSNVNTTQFWRRSLNQTDLHYQSFAGYQQINWYRPKGDSGMYYQLFGSMGSNVSQSDPKIPLIIWLQGGPGSSSMYGAFTQLGPIRIVNGKPKSFAYPWNFFGHLLFIDQPLNVGFSFYGNRTGQKQVSSADQSAAHLLNFMSNFYKEWPTLRDSPLYIAGESYAGHYVPAFGRTIIQNATFLAQTNVKLKGIIIGDGWTDPINQINFYDSMLYSAGIVSNKYRDAATWFQTQGIVNIYKKDYETATSYFDIMTNNDTTSQVYWGGMSIFNIRQYTDSDSSFSTFIQTNKASLGVYDKIDYIDGNDQVYQNFHKDVTTSYSSDVIILLKKTKVLIYNGQNDFVVNTAGVLQYLNGLNWEGLESWKRARKQVWTINGQVRGWAKVSGNLWFGLVNGAGHMVPADQPESVFSLIGHFMTNNRNWRE